MRSAQTTKGTKTENNLDFEDYISIFDDLKEAVEEIKLAEAGEIKLQFARDLINEL